jgi:hypothetical protein
MVKSTNGMSNVSSAILLHYDDKIVCVLKIDNNDIGNSTFHLSLYIKKGVWKYNIGYFLKYFLFKIY